MEPIKTVTLEKTYNTSLETMWQAWTDPAMLKQWWGPDNVSIPECEVALHVGGKFYIVMEAGEAMGPYKGTLWPMQATFTAIEPNTALSYDAQAWTEGHKETTMIDQVTTITFSEHEDMVMVKVVASILKTGPDATMAVEGMQAGFTQQLEKLNVFLTHNA